MKMLYIAWLNTYNVSPLGLNKFTMYNSFGVLHDSVQNPTQYKNHFKEEEDQKLEPREGGGN